MKVLCLILALVVICDSVQEHINTGSVPTGFPVYMVQFYKQDCKITMVSRPVKYSVLNLTCTLVKDEGTESGRRTDEIQIQLDVFQGFCIDGQITGNRLTVTSSGEVYWCRQRAAAPQQERKQTPWLLVAPNPADRQDISLRFWKVNIDGLSTELYPALNYSDISALAYFPSLNMLFLSQGITHKSFFISIDVNAVDDCMKLEDVRDVAANEEKYMIFVLHTFRIDVMPLLCTNSTTIVSKSDNKVISSFTIDTKRRRLIFARNRRIESRNYEGKVSQYLVNGKHLEQSCLAFDTDHNALYYSVGTNLVRFLVTRLKKEKLDGVLPNLPHHLVYYENHIYISDYNQFNNASSQLKRINIRNNHFNLSTINMKFTGRQKSLNFCLIKEG